MTADTHHDDQLLCHIEARLRNDGARERQRAPESLHRDIMAAVRAVPPAPQHVVSFRFPVWVTSLAASMLVLLGGLLAVRQAQEHVAQPLAMAELSAYETRARELIAELPQRLADPMERELAHLTDDLQHGAQFLLAQISYEFRH